MDVGLYKGVWIGNISLIRNTLSLFSYWVFFCWKSAYYNFLLSYNYKPYLLIYYRRFSSSSFYFYYPKNEDYEDLWLYFLWRRSNILNFEDLWLSSFWSWDYLEFKDLRVSSFWSRDYLDLGDFIQSYI